MSFELTIALERIHPLDIIKQMYKHLVTRYELQECYSAKNGKIKYLRKTIDEINSGVLIQWNKCLSLQMVLLLVSGIGPPCGGPVSASKSHLERRLSFFGDQTSLKLFKDLGLKLSLLPKCSKLNLGRSVKVNDKNMIGFHVEKLQITFASAK